jgi:predicted transcriptional regulator
MAKRTTIMLDDDIDKKLHLIQAKQISKTHSSVSFPNVINEAIRRQLK